jgi:uncharacterized DUF497 family protein
VRIVPNPEKEAINRRKHGLDFSRVIDILRGPGLEEPDDRPLGYQHEARMRVCYQHEARMRVYGVLDMRAVVLIYEPVEAGTGSVALRPISLR